MCKIFGEGLHSVMQVRRTKLILPRFFFNTPIFASTYRINMDAHPFIGLLGVAMWMLSAYFFTVQTSNQMRLMRVETMTEEMNVCCNSVG
jgi:hypothetical protein